jgi:hypothetical protein
MITSVDGKHFLLNPSLHQEVFGPYSLVIRCTDAAEMLEVAKHLEGQLTATCMATETDMRNLPELVNAIQDICGRIIMNGVPTGVEVCLAMHHGGPFPASTDARFSSVGADGIRRFSRPVAFQNWPDSLLPDVLKMTTQRKSGVRSIMAYAIFSQPMMKRYNLFSFSLLIFSSTHSQEGPMPENKEIRHVLASITSFRETESKRDSLLHHPLGSFTENDCLRRFTFYHSADSSLQSIDTSKLSFKDKINHILLRYSLEDEISDYQFKWYLNPILSDAGFHTELTGMSNQVLSNKKEFEPYQQTE